MDTYTPPPTHPLNDEEKEYIKTLSPKELALHELAIEKLGSSYFVWKSHGFIAWKAKK
jgi:hypothetical protein|uniref:Uncharacterized protein n=1 Tax=viral metagenome TaxID=1070528 RepID=A0A6C0IEF6_9ZZZZ